jgi:hypothetical protein
MTNNTDTTQAGLVEKVARAIHVADDSGDRLPWDVMSSFGDMNRKTYRRLASAAIAAISEAAEPDEVDEAAYPERLPCNGSDDDGPAPCEYCGGTGKEMRSGLLHTDFMSMLDLAKIDMKIWQEPLYKKFIAGTPLENDVPVWMVQFAQRYLRIKPTNSEASKIRQAHSCDIPGCTTCNNPELPEHEEASHEQ